MHERAAIILLWGVLFILYFNKDLSYSLYLLQIEGYCHQQRAAPEPTAVAATQHVQRAILRDGKKSAADKYRADKMRGNNGDLKGCLMQVLHFIYCALSLTD